MLQIVITLEIYGVKQIVGIPFGYRGFSDTSLAEMPVSVFLQGYSLSANDLSIFSYLVTECIM